MENESAALERPQDAGQGPRGVVARWMMEIKLASKEEEDWRKHARKTMERYRDEERREKAKRAGSSRFNILYANTEIQRPSLYSNTPRADIRRRRKQDENPQLMAQDVLARAVAEGMERAASYMIDQVNFDFSMKLAVQDYLLPGRSVTRLRYVPTIQDEQVVDEKLELEHVDWDRFRRGPGANWSQVNWIAFELILDRNALVQKFGDAGKRVELDVTRETTRDEKKDERTIFSRGRVWEIWDKKSRKIIYIAPSVEDAPLLEEDDPLKLKQFYPIPRPLYYSWTTDTLVPIEGDRQYRDQAEELDQVTVRIRRLTAAMKARGIYDATITEMARLLEGGDNEFIPSQGAQNILAQTGTLERHIWMLPISDFAQALAQLYQQREQIKQTIYEITGLSDILRGASDANETLGAQKLKAQTGSLRLQERQREVQRYARDLIEMMCEVMAEHFQQDTLSMIVGEPVSPEAMQMLRSQGLRDVSINIETDSTISVDQSQDQEAVTQLLDGVTRYMSAIAPAVEAGVVSMDAAKAILVSAVRRFRLGREVEEQLEDQGSQQQPQIPPEQIQQMQEQAMQQAEQAVQQDRMRLEQEKAKVEQEKQALASQEREMQLSKDFQTKALDLEKREALADLQKAELRLEQRGMKVEKLGKDVDDAIANVEAQTDENAEKSERLHDMDEQIREMSKAVAALAQTVAEANQTQLESNSKVLEALSADKEVIYDKGRPVGTRLKVVK